MKKIIIFTVFAVIAAFLMNCTSQPEEWDILKNEDNADMGIGGFSPNTEFTNSFTVISAFLSNHVGAEKYAGKRN